jgi:hypothetical protein
MNFKMLKRGANTVFLLLIAFTCILTVPSYAGFLSTNGGCENGIYGYGPGAGFVKNQSAANLPTGSVLQYIFAGANDTNDPPNLTTGGTTGDDVLLATQSVGTDNVYLLVSGQAGLFYCSVSNAANNANITASHSKVYVRAWNASSFAAATYYGDSALWTAAFNANFSPLPNDYTLPSFSTNVSVVGLPSISSITPNNGTQGATIPTVTIVGSNTHFGGTTTVSFGSNITVGSVSVSDATHLTCNNVVINASAATGARTVTVTTGSEAPTGTFTVNAVGAPTISSITPNNGNQGATINNVAIVGVNTHFVNGSTTVSFGTPDITVSNILVTGPTALTCNIVISGSAATGAKTVTVTTGSEAPTGTFTVNQNTSITPPPGAFFAHGGGIMMAYPNPFNPNDKANPLKMLFQVTAGDTVNIYIFDANGRIIYQDKDAQTNLLRIVTWDGESSYGGTVNNGLYLIMIVNNGKLVAKAKILVVKK